MGAGIDFVGPHRPGWDHLQILRGALGLSQDGQVVWRLLDSRIVRLDQVSWLGTRVISHPHPCVGSPRWCL